MVISGNKRLMLLVLCVCLILSVLKCQVAELGWDRFKEEIAVKQQGYTEKISAEELDDFISLGTQFKELGWADDLMVSYKISRPSKFMDWKSKMWFVYHKWDADRFFYVQQRLSALLYTLSVRRNAEALITMLQDRTEPVAKQMLEIQKQRSLSGQEDLDELKLVESKEEVLKKLFE